MSPAELSALAKRLRNRAESIVLRDQPEMQRDMRAAASLIDGVARSSDLLVDITDMDGKVSRSVLLWEAIGDDEEEYEDCRNTLLADRKCTTGGGAAPIYFLELVGNLILIDVKGGTVVAVTGLPPATGYLIRYGDGHTAQRELRGGLPRLLVDLADLSGVAIGRSNWPRQADGKDQAVRQRPGSVRFFA